MKRVFYIMAVAFNLIGCSEKEEVPVEISQEPAITEIGMPLGAAVTKDIGSSGGMITSGDGTLDVIVPPGSVNTTTTFGIQPVENFCPGGWVSYKLLPEGLTFSQPVILVFHYTELDLQGSLTDFLGIAYQSQDKIWYRLPSATVDPAAKTVSVQVKHFTNWSLVSGLNIEPRNPPIRELDVKKSIDLWLSGTEDITPSPNGPPDNPSSDEDDLPPLPTAQPFQSTWFVNGDTLGNSNVGTITIGQHGRVTYTAPDKEPANNPVTIKAVLTEYRFYDYIGRRKRTFNRVEVLKQIKIICPKFNYTLKVELTQTDVCGYKGQTLTDVAEMDVFVDCEEVTVTNFKNGDATIAPTIIHDIGCDIHCNRAGGGPLNANAGSGTVTEEPFAPVRGLQLTIIHNDATTPDQIISCPNAPDVPNPSQKYVFTENFNFLLQRDSAQHIRESGGRTTDFYKVTLTPK
jgi:hypothetical protein